MKKKILNILIFEAVQKHASHIGIDSDLSKQNRRFNSKNLTCFSVLGILSIFSDLYFIRIASTFGEYTRSVYITSMSNAVFLVFTIAIWQIKPLFQFIDDVRRFASE